MSVTNIDYLWFKFINNKVLQYQLIDHIMILFAEYVQYAFVLLIFIFWLLRAISA
ncbi:hypothetical protein [Peribacillus huizhouensis]|uniref:Uncharacterized protein n=1 Tax=Peribacillus huizhouensis TaxID=1501239 RepID=A0ABR6CKE6_9BACI|nr:hypothetical protein [Peribacillus huizhouensis]